MAPVNKSILPSYFFFSSKKFIFMQNFAFYVYDV